MEYRITLHSHPRVVFVFLIVIALPALGIASFFFIPLFFAIIIAGVCGVLSYNFLKMVGSTLASRIRTSEESISFNFGKKHTDEFPWESIDHAGEYTEPSGARWIFVYAEENDQLVTVPTEYERFDELVEEVRKGVGDRFETVEIGSSATIADYLRAKVVPAEDAAEDDDALEDDDTPEEQEDEPPEDS